MFAGSAGRREAGEVCCRKGIPAQIRREADQKTVLGHLSAMGQQSLALQFAERTDIERYRRRLGTWARGTVWPPL